MSRRLQVESLEARKLMAVDVFMSTDTFERPDYVPAAYAPEIDMIAAGGEGEKILVGMLLPAVQKVREAAARVSTSGEKSFDLDLAIDLAGGLQLKYQLKDVLVSSVQNSSDDQILIGLLMPAVNEALDIQTGDKNGLIGMLLPAVQKVREAAARMSAAGEKTFDLELSINLGDGLKPLQIELENVLVSSWQTSSDSQILIGLLLPAVHKAREAASYEGSHALYQDVFIPANTQSADDVAAVDAVHTMGGEFHEYTSWQIKDSFISS